MVLLAHFCEAAMRSRGKISPSVQTLRSDSELALSVCSIHEIVNSDPDVEQTYMSQDQGPYTMTPVQELKPPASPNTQNPTLEHNVIKSVSLDSVLCTTRSNKHRSRPQDSVLEQHTPEGRVQHTHEGTVLEQHMPYNSRKQDDTRDAAVVIDPRVNPVSRQITDQPQSMCTVANGLLSTSGFVWIPLCKPGQRSQTLSFGDAYLDARYEEAQQCTRHQIR